MKKIENYINGVIKSFSTNYLSVEDPSKGEKLEMLFYQMRKIFSQ